MLELRNIKKQYNSNIILEIPALTLENGIHLIKGANGTGKTTLLKIVAGLMPFEGDILLNTISLKNDPVIYRQKISWAETEPLYPEFVTGVNLVNLYKTIRKVSQKEIDLLLERYNMMGYINDATGTYSAGMTKKLSLVLAFIGNPQLIMLDEPLITLDTATCSLTCSLIIEKNKNFHTNFLISSHQDLITELSGFGSELIVENKTIHIK